MKMLACSPTPKMICILAVSFFLTGCISSKTHVSGIEPYARTLRSHDYTVVGVSEGQSSSFNLLWLFPVTPRVDYQEAVDEAITKLGGDDLIEVRTWIRKEYWIVGTVNILLVRGKVIQYGTMGKKMDTQ